MASEEESNFTAPQVAIFLSPKCRSAPNDPEEKHVQASEEDSNFCQTKEVAEIIHLQHPFVYDQLALCALAMEGTLKYLKLHMLQ